MDGTNFASRTSSETGSGLDLYFDRGTKYVGNVTPSTNGSVGNTWLIDVLKELDKGQDTYSVTVSGTAARTLDGTITLSETHHDTDDGTSAIYTKISSITRPWTSVSRRLMPS